MFWIYWFKRRLRRLLWSIFNGLTPEWATDAWLAIGTFNFVALVPTILAIALTPEHFFKRLTLLTLKRPSGVKQMIHKSPISFASSVATLIVATKWFVNYIPTPRVKFALMIIAVGLPVFIPAICLVLLGFTHLAYFLGTRGLLAPGILSSKKERDKIVLHEIKRHRLRYLRVPLSPTTYQHLDSRKMVWSLIYLYGYLISFPLFFAWLIFSLIYQMAREHLPSILHPDFDKLSGHLSTYIISVTVIAIAVSALLGRLIVYPYTTALLGSLKSPTHLLRRIVMHKCSVAGIRLARYLELHKQFLNGKTRLRHMRGDPCVGRNLLLQEVLAFRSEWKEFHAFWPRYTRRFRIAIAERDEELCRLISCCRCAGYYGYRTSRNGFSESEMDALILHDGETLKRLSETYQTLHKKLR